MPPPYARKQEMEEETRAEIGWSETEETKPGETILSDGPCTAVLTAAGPTQLSNLLSHFPSLHGVQQVLHR